MDLKYLNPEYVNLLPAARVRQLRRDYFMRLSTATILLLSFLVVVACIMLAPAYLYLSGERADAAAGLGAANSKLSTTNASSVNAALSTITSDASSLTGLGSAPSASASLYAVLAAPRAGITLTNISYTAPSAAKSGAKLPGTLVLTGTADTREDLRSFDDALAALSFITSANLPIDAYAKESDIDFSVTLSGTFTP